jgi:hypothetical protein
MQEAILMSENIERTRTDPYWRKAILMVSVIDLDLSIFIFAREFSIVFCTHTEILFYS